MTSFWHFQLLVLAQINRINIIVSNYLVRIDITRRTIQIVTDQLTPTTWCSANVKYTVKANIVLVKYFSDLVGFLVKE